MKKNGPEPPFFAAGFVEDAVEAGALGAFGAAGVDGALGAAGAAVVARTEVDDVELDALVDARPLRVGTSGTVTVIVEPFAARAELFLTAFLVTFLALFFTGRLAAVAFFATFFAGRFAAAFFGAALVATFFTGRLAADFFAVFLAVRFAATYSTP